MKNLKLLIEAVLFGMLVSLASWGAYCIVCPQEPEKEIEIVYIWDNMKGNTIPCQWV